MLRLFCFVLIVFGVPARVGAATFPTPTNNQPTTSVPLTPPQDALRMIHLPPGFQATLFAAEPDVQNPVALCWDERGRLWVAEYYTYSDSVQRFDPTLRDRILIFEDTDNDGRFDKRTVFAENFQHLTSIERGFGGVYALCPPHLLFIPTDGDQPSGPPQVLLDGFNFENGLRHTIANGLKWGPDGWLYGRHGITSTSFVGVPGTPAAARAPMAGGIWRYHPTKKIYEPYCHGTTNPWGSDWNDDGELFFINTVIGHLWHGIPGAHLKRMSGEDPYPRIYELIDQHADHYHWDTGKKWTETRHAVGTTDGLGGGHVHAGLTIYGGPNLPASFRGKLLTNNFYGRRINIDRLERVGSGYVARHEEDFLKSDDPWYRPVEISTGPDGALTILDWSDTDECHENDGVHRTSGRIYKISYGQPVRPPETDLTRLDDTRLVALQLSDNEWLVRMARWELRERQARGVLTPAAITALQGLNQQPLPSVQQRKVWWTLATLGLFLKDEHDIGTAVWPTLASGRSDEYLEAIRFRVGLADRSPEFLAQHFAADSAATRELAAKLTAESSAFLRLKWAGLLPKLPAAARVEAARGLLSHVEDATDHNLPWVIWSGLTGLAPADLVSLFAECRLPQVRRFIARRLAEDIDKDPAALNALLRLPADALAADMVAGLSDALKGWPRAQKPAAWDEFAARHAGAADPALAVALRNLGVLFGGQRSIDEVRAIVLDKKASPENRQAALRMLIDAQAADLRALCESLLDAPALRRAAIEGLAAFDDPVLAEKILQRYPQLPAAERPAVVAVLASRPSFARVLLAQLNRTVPRADITPVVARQIRSLNDAALTARLAEQWGELHETTADKAQLIATLKARLTPEVLRQANPSRGRAVFANTCAACHNLYGEGGNLGPNLTGSGRHDLNYLLENIVAPSAVVAADFRLVVLTLKDGRVLNGMIKARTERTLTIGLLAQETVVSRDLIASQESLPVSMMPEGLLTALSDDQVRDLFAYLMTREQVPLATN